MRPRHRAGGRLDRLGRGASTCATAARRFGGFDVQRALANVNGEIAAALVGRSVLDQAGNRRGADRARRHAGQVAPRRQRHRRGVAARRARRGGTRRVAAVALPRRRARRWRLPLPQIQIFGGGAHAGRRVDVQDFMVIAVGAGNFAEALDWTAEVYRAAGALLARAGRRAGVADEGGYWPAFETNEEALD